MHFDPRRYLTRLRVCARAKRLDNPSSVRGPFHGAPTVPGSL